MDDARLPTAPASRLVHGKDRSGKSGQFIGAVQGLVDMTRKADQ
ncbi:hypothetical protein [Aureimonas sp. Leaf427]|nr:hypothetical protein [Aureimonas sp. Leaf427]